MSARYLLVAAVLAVSPMAADAVQCRSDYDIDGDVDLRSANGDIVFKRDGAVVVRITERPELVIGDRTIELDDAARADLAAYHASYTQLVDEAKAVGLAGAKLGGRAAFSIIVGLLTGKAEEAEAKIEAEADKLEAQAEALCLTVNRLNELHRAISARVPEFAEALPVR